MEIKHKYGIINPNNFKYSIGANNEKNKKKRY